MSSEGEGRSFALHAVCFQYDIVAAGDVLRDGEPEAGAAFPVRAESVENMRQKLGGDTGTVIRDGYAPTILRKFDVNFNGAAFR